MEILFIHHDSIQILIYAHELLVQPPKVAGIGPNKYSRFHMIVLYKCRLVNIFYGKIQIICQKINLQALGQIHWKYGFFIGNQNLAQPCFIHTGYGPQCVFVYLVKNMKLWVQLPNKSEVFLIFHFPSLPLEITCLI